LTLLFIPAAGSARAEWAFQAEHFTDSEVVVLPGHNDGKPLPTIDEYAAWLRSYIRQKQFKDVVLIGHSMGGAIVLLYALKHGADLKGIVLVGSGARLRVAPERLQRLKNMIADEVGWRRILANEFRFVPPQVRRSLIYEGVKIGAVVALSDHLACDRFDVIDRVHLINIPTLVICGDNDVSTPVKYADYLASRIPGAKKVIITGGDHWVHLEKPTEVNRAVQEFLNKLC
jgi:pimeloyl-ACP methyl ester carboxylesterase